MTQYAIELPSTTDHLNQEVRKRAGQYFSGVGLARLLAALANAGNAETIIDPMAGLGDMLVGCLEVGAQPRLLCGVEIDPKLMRRFPNRLPGSVSLRGNAFSPHTIARLPTREWDLVITNPPYVRYQSLTQQSDGQLKLPSATEVRRQLRATIDLMPALDTTDRTLFRRLVDGYSGFADLAVPSWILCAALVREGGRLAIVAPESWMSREYAATVQYMLLRWFRIEKVVDDQHAMWFADAQIKTTLVIARRIRRRASAFDWHASDRVVRTSLSSLAGLPGRPIANVFPASRKPELHFNSRLAAAAKLEEPDNTPTHHTTLPSLNSFGRRAQVVCSRQRWLGKMNDELAQNRCVSHSAIPNTLAAWLERGHGSPLLPFESLGARIGQGLRTGANSFFYVTALTEHGKTCIIAFDGLPGKPQIEVEASILRPVLRRQSELSPNLVVHASSLPGRVLDLRRVALESDLRSGGAAARREYRPMSEAIATIVQRLQRSGIGTGTRKAIHELTAVATNVRPGDRAEGKPPRYWYMLPDFAPRHRPDVCIPRVNHKSPKAWLIDARSALVDANFITVSAPDCAKAPIDACALFAILNSTWARANLEHMGSVLGGGGLKIEAAHLRTLAIPALSNEDWRKLSAYGSKLSQHTSLISEVDQLITTRILGRAVTRADSRTLESLLSAAGESRSAQRRRISQRLR